MHQREKESEKFDNKKLAWPLSEWHQRAPARWPDAFEEALLGGWRVLELLVAVVLPQWLPLGPARPPSLLCHVNVVEVSGPQSLQRGLPVLVVHPERAFQVQNV